MLNWCARRVWGSMLWFMRRRPIKALRTGWIRWVPAQRREKAWEDFKRQERWARRHGVTILQWTIGFAMFALGYQAIAAWTIMAQANGVFSAKP